MADDRDLRVLYEQLQTELRRLDGRLKETGRHSRQYYDSLHARIVELTAQRDALLQSRAALVVPPPRAIRVRVLSALAGVGIGVAFVAPFALATLFILPGLVGHGVDLGRFFLAGGIAATGALGVWWSAIHNPLIRNNAP
ncbi:MAG: hypothetical protein ACJ790_16895 [Myxococcaceae bacterium]